MSKNEEKVIEKRELSLHGIRDVLWEDIQAVREGKETAANLQAVTKASGMILSSVALELKYAQITGKTPNIKMVEGN